MSCSDDINSPYWIPVCKTTLKRFVLVYQFSCRLVRHRTIYTNLKWRNLEKVILCLVCTGCSDNIWIVLTKWLNHELKGHLTLAFSSESIHCVVTKALHKSVVVFVIERIKTLVHWTTEGNIFIVICDCDIRCCSLCGWRPAFNNCKN